MAERPWESQYPDGVNWHIDIAARPVQALLDTAAQEAPDQILCEFLGREFTVREIAAESDRVATGLQAMGVGKGVHVGLLLPNMPQYITCLFGILKAGGTVVNYSPLLAEQELIYQIDDSETRIMITMSAMSVLPNLIKAMPQTGLEKVVVCAFAEVLPFPKGLLYKLLKAKDISPLPADPAYVRYDELISNDGGHETPPLGDLTEEVAVLQYTGGTTGTPKGAMLTHANLTATNTIYGEWSVQFDIGKSGIDRTLLVLPLFHIFGLSAVLLGCIRDRTQVILHPIPDIDRIIDDVRTKKPTVLPGVPTLFTAIANHPKAAATDFSALQYCVSGGAPLPNEVQERFGQVTGVRLYEGYGLTESSPAATGQVRDAAPRQGSCGVPLPATDLEIRSLDDGTTVMPTGEIGEVCIKGPQVMKGYWKRPDESADALRNGWLHTGDTGYLDDDGYVFLVDRSKDLIISSGFNVYPRHVEEAIYQHPAIGAVTVIGIPDDYRGEAAKAFVELRDGQSLHLDELLEFLGDKLAKYALPVAMEIRDELPRTPVGKLSKKELVAEEKAKAAAAPDASDTADAAGD